MAKKPPNFEWVGYTDDQRRLLNFVDHLGNNGWARNSQSDAIMVNVLKKCEEGGLGIEHVVHAMAAIGYSPQALHQLERWESKRTTGKFGR